jgi:GntR family transcriptional regulator, transcriptional repressor for pyruvate dehydrogenase complex
MTDASALDLIDGSKLYGSIVRQILDGIEAGTFAHGSALPAERVLAAQLGVGRSSVREAIRVLEHAGILDVRSGSGTYVVDPGSPKAAILRAEATLTGEHSPLDVMTARRVLEPECAALAAAQRHERDLELLGDAVERQHRLVATGADPAAADIDFHLMLARATHNPVLALLLERVVDIMRRPTWTGLKLASREHAGAEQDVVEHAAVLDAVTRRDEGGAAAAMASHLASVERDLSAQVD